jgi:hypothetical protein
VASALSVLSLLGPEADTTEGKAQQIKAVCKAPSGKSNGVDPAIGKCHRDDRREGEYERHLMQWRLDSPGALNFACLI